MSGRHVSISFETFGFHDHSVISINHPELRAGPEVGAISKREQGCGGQETCPPCDANAGIVVEVFDWVNRCVE